MKKLFAIFCLATVCAITLQARGEMRGGEMREGNFNQHPMDRGAYNHPEGRAFERGAEAGSLNNSGAGGEPVYVTPPESSQSPY